MELLMDILTLFCKVLTGYTAVVGLFFLLPRPKRPRVAPKTRFAVVIPARNEENVIEDLVKSLYRQDYPGELFDVFVVPNNCTDDTEGAARRAGARILTCRGQVKSKGEVLHDVFDQLMGHYDAYCVFDADNLAASDFLSRMNDAVCTGAHVAKSRQLAQNPYDSWISGCYDLYFENFNLLYSRPRERLGLSAKLVGTGFMVTDDLLHRMGGWNTRTLTEDAEFAAQCAIAGERVHYVPQARNFDEQPLTLALSMRQRRRWSAGVMDTANRYVFRLLARPSRVRVDLAILLSMIYAQLLAAVPLVYSLAGLPLAEATGKLAAALAGYWAGLVLTALFLAVKNRRSVRKMWKSILLYPLFLASWYPLHVLSLVAKPRTWRPIPHGQKQESEAMRR